MLLEEVLGLFTGVFRIKIKSFKFEYENNESTGISKKSIEEVIYAILFHFYLEHLF